MQIYKYETQKSIKDFNANSYLQKFISQKRSWVFSKKNQDNAKILQIFNGKICS